MQSWAGQEQVYCISLISYDNHQKSHYWQPWYRIQKQEKKHNLALLVCKKVLFFFQIIHCSVICLFIVVQSLISIAYISSAHFWLEHFRLSNNCTFNQTVEWKTCLTLLKSSLVWTINAGCWSVAVFFLIRQSYRKWWARGRLMIL